MAKSIPKEVEIVNGIKIKVIQKELPSTHLGRWEVENKTIYINSLQSNYSKWVTLLHEVLHAIDDELILAGKKKIAFTEKAIEFAASNIFGFLVINNFTKLVKLKDVEKELLFVEDSNRDVE